MKISIITPVYNGEAYLEKCILSIRNQKYSNFEHIIMDGGSTDNTLKIIKKYEHTYNMIWVSQPDNGMYDAIVKGFELATGDILGWLNSDDIYFNWTFEILNEVFSRSDVKWVTGLPTFINVDGILRCQVYHTAYDKLFIQKGYHDGRILPFIQQESTFWTRDLWERADGKEIKKYKLAGDFQLWRKFAAYEKLYRIDSILASFRQHDGQKSGDIDKYYNETIDWGVCEKVLNLSRILTLIDRMNLLFNPKRNMISLEDINCF